MFETSHAGRLDKLVSDGGDSSRATSFASWLGKAARMLLAAALAVTLCPLPQRAYADPLAAATVDPDVLAGEVELSTESVDAAPMYRLYNKWTNEHFFTSDYSEYRGLVRKGWNDEKIGWYAPASGSPVYRLYNKWSGDHHFTTSKSEYDKCVKVGWKGENVAFYSGGGDPVYRLFNKYVTSFYHHYTMSRDEYNTCIKNGWTDEKVGWYGYAEKPSQSTTTPTTPSQPDPVPTPTPDPEPEPVYNPESYDYTVTYDSGSGSFDAFQTIQSKAVTANSSVPFKLETAMGFKDGYDHTSWNTKEDGSGTEYALGQQVNDISKSEMGEVDNTGASTKPNHDVKLYAQYTPRSNKVFFIVGQNRGSIHDELDELRPSILCDQNGSFTLPDNVYDFHQLSGASKQSTFNVRFFDAVSSSASEDVEACAPVKQMVYRKSVSKGWYERNGSSRKLYEDGYVFTDVVQDYRFEPAFNLETSYNSLTVPYPDTSIMSAHRGQRFLGWTMQRGSSKVDYPVGTKKSDPWRMLYAVWGDASVPDVNYKVEHYQQKVNGGTAQNTTNYSLESTQTLSAQSGTSVSPEPNIYTGFITPSNQAITVAADGTTVVRYYYNRSSYTVTVGKDSGIASANGAGTYRYGQTVSVSAMPGTDNLFARWTGSYSSYNATFTFVMPARNISLTATSKPNPDKIKPIEPVTPTQPEEPTPTPSDKDPDPTPSVQEEKITQVTNLPEGYYMLANCANKNLNLDVNGASTVNGANLQVFTGTKYTSSASANDAQVFYIQPSGVSGYYKINNAKSAMAIDVVEGKTAVGSNIQQWEYSGNNQELWQLYQKSSDNSFIFVSKIGQNRVLGVASASPVSGANVALCEKTYADSQRWILTKLTGYNKLPAKTSLATGAFFFRSIAKGSYLGVSKEYAAVTTSSSQTGQQVWNVNAMSGGYQLLNHYWAYAGLDQDTRNASTLQTWDASGAANQTWNVYPSFWGGVMLVPNSGKNMAAYCATSSATPKLGNLVGNVANKTYAWKPMAASGTYQRAAVSLDTSGTSLLKSGVTANLNFNLTVPQSGNAGLQTTITTSRSSNRQKWYIYRKGTVPSTTGGFFKGESLYQFKNVYSAKALDSDTNSNKVQQWDVTTGNSQLWVARRSTVKGQFILMSYFYNRALDVSGGVAVEGGPTITWTQNGTAAQNWVQEKIGISSDYAIIYHDDLARQLFAEYNNFRVNRANNRPLRTVTWSDDCAYWARRSAEWCANNGRLAHRMNSSSEWPTKVESGRTVPKYCDILAYDGKITAYQMIEKWRIDQGHPDGGHRKMMQCATTNFAGAAVVEKNGKYYYVIAYDYNGRNQDGN